MDILYAGYNIPIVVIDGQITPSTPKTVGGITDFLTLLNLVKKSGIVICKANIGGVQMHGPMMAAPYANDDGIEFHTISKAGDAEAPYIVFAQLVMDDGDAKITVTTTTIS